MVRALLLPLAVALMESLGIRGEVCDEPEYTAMQGFVLDRHKSAIVANWVGTDGIWQVDVTDPLDPARVRRRHWLRLTFTRSSPLTPPGVCTPGPGISTWTEPSWSVAAPNSGSTAVRAPQPAGSSLF